MKKISNKRYLKENRKFPFFITRGTTKKVHFLRIPFVLKTIKFIFNVTGFSKILYKESLKLKHTTFDIFFDNIPNRFKNLRILFLTDLHVDVSTCVAETLKKIISEIEYDVCIFGGDFVGIYNEKSKKYIKDYYSELIPLLKKKTSNIFGVLGNHDKYELGEYLESIGVKMLVNEAVKLGKGKSSIYIAGIDDPSYYGTHDFKECQNDIEEDDCFKILVSHTPGIYKFAKKYNYSLTLSGHTHAGQICLPGGIPVLTNTSAPRRMVRGHWKYKNVHGYTSKGVGCSGMQGRLFCQPEAVTIILRRQKPVKKSLYSSNMLINAR